jgi:DNA-binding beta-propeller fold protein YncE
MKMRKQLFCGMLLVLSVALSVVLSSSAKGPVEYQLKQKFTLGGDGSWDYLSYDPQNKRLFISRSTRVQVVDPEKGTVIAEIANTPGVHGIALALDLGKGFTSNGQENSVTVFDLKTLKETGRIKLEGAQGPDAILYDPGSKRVFTFNGRTRNASVIDATNDTVAATIALDGRPEFGATDGNGMVYVNIEDKSEMQSIDAKNAKVTATWPLTGCEEPSGLAIDQKHHRLFSGCHNKVMAIVNADSGKVITTVPIGQGVDANGFDPGTELAFSSNGDGTLTVVHEDSPEKFTVAQNAETQRGARTMAVNPSNHEVYLVTAEIEEQPPAEGQTRPRRTMKPGSFTLLVMAKK